MLLNIRIFLRVQAHLCIWKNLTENYLHEETMKNIYSVSRHTWNEMIIIRFIYEIYNIYKYNDEKRNINICKTTYIL